MSRQAQFQPVSALRGLHLACLLGATLLFGCERGDRIDHMNPLPTSGFSETVSVGNRGTEKGGFFDRGEAPPTTAPAGAAATSAALPIAAAPLAPAAPSVGAPVAPAAPSAVAPSSEAPLAPAAPAGAQ